MSSLAWTLLLLLLQVQPVFSSLQERKANALLSHKGMGEPCQHNSECQSNCCVANSLNPQTFCTPQTIFLRCVPWRKPNGHRCTDHWECSSDCCVRTGYSALLFCTPKTIFMQCVPWRKPNGDYCKSHADCGSLCCLRVRKAGSWRCTRRSGILAKCLPLG